MGARQTAAAKANAKNAKTGHLGKFILADLDRASRPGALCAAGAAIATLGARARLPDSAAASHAAFPESRPLRRAAVRADE
jgi:hypothetical protein